MPTTAPDYSRSYLSTPGLSREDLAVRMIHRILSGGAISADTPYDPREIRASYLMVRQDMQGEIDRLNAERKYKDAEERARFSKEQYFQDMDFIYKFGGTSDDHIISLLDWPVSFDASQSVYYSLLPDSYVNVARYRLLPGEEQVKAIQPMLMKDRRKRRFIPLAKGQERLIEGLQGNYGFWREGPKLLYYGEVPDKTLKIDYVLRPERDQLPSPGLLQDAQDDVIIAKVVGTLMRRQAEDKTNDNNATT